MCLLFGAAMGKKKMCLSTLLYSSCFLFRAVSFLFYFFGCWLVLCGFAFVSDNVLMSLTICVLIQKRIVDELKEYPRARSLILFPFSSCIHPQFIAYVFSHAHFFWFYLCRSRCFPSCFCYLSLHS